MLSVGLTDAVTSSDKQILLEFELLTAVNIFGIHVIIYTIKILTLKLITRSIHNQRHGLRLNLHYLTESLIYLRRRN